MDQKCFSVEEIGKSQVCVLFDMALDQVSMEASMSKCVQVGSLGHCNLGEWKSAL